MAIYIQEERTSVLREYGLISTSFEVDRVLEVDLIDDGLGGVTFSNRRVEFPFTKSYDEVVDSQPWRWGERFDTSTWVVLSAWSRGARVGGMVIAFDSPGVDMLEGRRDLAVIWDLRVDVGFRRQGIGTALLRYATSWSLARGCRQLKVETQNINVRACTLYIREGFVLGSMNRFAYPDFPDETQLIWYKSLLKNEV